MTKKDLEKKLQEAASRVELPSDLDATYRLVKQIPPDLSPAPSKKKFFSWKWAAPSAAVAACALALAIVLPSVLRTSSVGETPNPDSSAIVPPTPLPGEMTTAEANAISRQAVALFALAPSFEEGTSPLSLARRMARYERDDAQKGSLTQDEKQAVAEEIEGFIYMVEEIQTAGAWNVVFDPSTSLITVEGGETFLISYSETAIDASTQAFQGVVSYDGASGTGYAFKGTIEDKGSETNVKMDLEMPAGGFIRVEQEIEAAENEYQFSFYEGGATRPYREIEYESEIEGRERESQIEVREGSSTVECEFEYKPTSSGATSDDEFMCEYTRESPTEELEAEVYIDKIEGGHSYRFAGDSSLITVVR